MEVLKKLFSSKKFTVALGTVIIAIVSSIGFDVDPELITKLLAFSSMYIGSQAVADHGKKDY